MDERFWSHRYKSTSHAAVAGAAVTVGWFAFEVLAHDQLRWDLASILVAMVLTKVAAMLWLRWRD